MSCWGQIDSKMCFWKIWVEYKCFWKAFHLILMYSIHKILCFEEFLHKIALFFQKFDFSRFSIDRVWFLINRKILDFSSLVFKYLTNLFFFHASSMFRIHMHCIVFCIHLAVLQSYLLVFSHITCIHLAKLGTQLDLKIDWLIFELCTL